MNVVAHEIAHSWCGNLVTNSTWSDFWLNEGHTVFVERKIISRIEGELSGFAVGRKEKKKKKREEIQRSSPLLRFVEK